MAECLRAARCESSHFLCTPKCRSLIDPMFRSREASEPCASIARNSTSVSAVYGCIQMYSIHVLSLFSGAGRIQPAPTEVKTYSDLNFSKSLLLTFNSLHYLIENMSSSFGGSHSKSFSRLPVSNSKSSSSKRLGCNMPKTWLLSLTMSSF